MSEQNYHCLRFFPCSAFQQDFDFDFTVITGMLLTQLNQAKHIKQCDLIDI